MPDTPVEMMMDTEKEGLYGMDEIYTGLAVKLQEVDSRSQSNSKRIDGHDNDIKEIREEQKIINTIVNSVDKIATSMVDIKEDIRDMKCGQTQLTEKVTILEHRPASEAKKKSILSGIWELKLLLLGLLQRHWRVCFLVFHGKGIQGIFVFNIILFYFKHVMKA